MLHGIISHGGWYGGSCQFLADAGHEVHFLDRRGSGLNGDARGDVDRWETWCDDVIGYLKHIRDDRPLVLCGISWGGKLAAAVARRKPHLIDGLGLLCPGLYAKQQPGLLRRLVLKAARSQRLQSRRLTVPLRKAELFTNTFAWQDYVRNDPLTLREVTLRFARADLQLTRFARESAPFIHMPTLLMLTGQDRIVANDATRGYFGRVAAADKRLVEYHNAAHTLEFEPDPTQYFEDLAAWVGRIEEHN
jgi:alpha-beta hydrolase superfamily lysophospholipase